MLDGGGVAAAAVVLAVVLGLVRVPDAALFGGLIAGLVRALAGRTRATVPRALNTAAQAVIGVSLGALVQLSPSPRSASTGCRSSWSPWAPCC
jgi:uncharacterized membrane protein AbrB (regulator of aidB expression)